MSEKLIMRHERLAFMNTGTASSATFKRMTGFTQLTDAKNPREYTRQYIDEANERNDVVGYAPEKSYSFDYHTENPVHAKLVDITDNEMIGTDTHVDIIVVDLFATGTSKPAKKRTYSVIPDTSDDGTDALIYTGTLRAAGEFTEGTATSSDNWQTITFTPTTTAGQS